MFKDMHIWELKSIDGNTHFLIGIFTWSAFRNFMVVLGKFVFGKTIFGSCNSRFAKENILNNKKKLRAKCKDTH